MDVIASVSQQSKVTCLLCNGLITLVEEEDRFALHMKSLHDVFYNLEFLLAACHMDEDEKDAVIGVMKVKTDKIQDSSEFMIESTEEDNKVTLFNEENNLILDDIKIKKVTVNIPIYRLQGGSSPNVPSLKTPTPSDKLVKTKVFICNHCNKEFPGAFQSLANHKVKEHKMSRRESQIITMEHVRYEDLPIPRDSKSSSSSDLPGARKSDLSDKFTDIFKPKQSVKKTHQVEKAVEVPMTTIKSELGTEELFTKEESKVQISEVCSLSSSTSKNSQSSQPSPPSPRPSQPSPPSQRSPPSKSSQLSPPRRLKVKQEKWLVKAKDQTMEEKLELIMSRHQGDLQSQCQVKKEVSEERSSVILPETDPSEPEFSSVTPKEPEPSAVSSTEPEVPQKCVLCNLKISSKSKLKLHMVKRHLVPEDRFYLFDDGGRSLFRVTDTQTSSRNNCKLCDESTANLGMLWNHYKKQHNMSKDTIKGLITKTKCNLCFSHVTFIADHYRTFHKDQEPPASLKENKSGPVLKTPIKDVIKMPVKEMSPSKSNQVKLAKIWESVSKRSPAKPLAKNTQWNNIFDNETLTKDNLDGPAVSNADDNEVTLNKESTDYAENKEAIKHVSENLPDKGHRCKECNKQFQSLRILRNHLLFHRSEVRNKVVPKPKILKEEPTEDYHFCDYCEYSSSSESEFKKHVQKNHKMEVDKEENLTLDEDIGDRAAAEHNIVETSVNTVTEVPAVVPHQKEYVAKLIDKLKDIDDDSDEEEEEEDVIDSGPEKEGDVSKITEGLSDSLFLSRLPRVLADNLRTSRYFSCQGGELRTFPGDRKAVGFTPDPPLGPGWSVRYSATAGGIQREFLSPQLILVKSAEAVVEYIICSNTHTPQSIINIKHYLGVE